MSYGSGVTEAQVTGALGIWELHPPPGLTDSGRIRRFQDRTVVRMRELAQEIAQPAFEELVRTVEATYTEGTGELASALTYSVEGDRDGVRVTFGVAQDVPHVVFLTALAGLPIASPGHWIAPRRAPKMSFFWKNPPQGGPPGVYSFKHPVFWHTRKRAGDVISEVLSSHSVRFQQVGIRAHEDALVELLQTGAESGTRSPRVSILDFNGIAPYNP